MDIDCEVELIVELSCEQLPSEFLRESNFDEQTGFLSDYVSTKDQDNLEPENIAPNIVKAASKTQNATSSLLITPEVKQVQKSHQSRSSKRRYTLLEPQLAESFQEVLGSVPGRANQAERIFSLISHHQNGSSTPLCLHGNTGCGKTSLMLKVIDFFRRKANKVSVAYVNCMNMWTVSQVYSSLLYKLFAIKERKSIRALDQLFKCTRFAANKKISENTKLIVLDEIDQLMNDASFLYNLLEWVGLADSRIVLVLISNVIDLTFKLETKLQSRMKFQRITFRPYSHLEIQDIIHYKYPSIETQFEIEAITFLAKKIANINSDIRLLEKVYEGLQQTHQWDHKVSIPDIQNYILVCNDMKAADLLEQYSLLTRVLGRATSKQQISSELFQKYLPLVRDPKDVTKSIMFQLAELQDMGFISLLPSRKNSDVTFRNVGIKIHEALRLICPEE